MSEWDLYDRETGERHRRSNRYGGAVRPTVSPDGRWLVYGTRHVDETGLRLRSLETGDERWLAYPVQRDEQESRGSRDALPGMSFTPDSREVIVTYGGKIWRVPLEDGAPVEIPSEVYRLHRNLGVASKDERCTSMSTTTKRGTRPGKPRGSSRW